VIAGNFLARHHEVAVVTVIVEAPASSLIRERHVPGW